MCYMECGGGGGGHYPPYPSPPPFRDLPLEQGLSTPEAVDGEVETFGNSPAPSAEPSEGARAPKGEASHVKLDNYRVPPPFK